ncbi:hypothetical protein [Streptomyces sp. NPDC021356]|uniref:hypothetical protein n=1 Tax=Streptomyces sp. NPDC021356 TaxID=3154900 RepID=UPI0033DE2FD1
MPETGALPAAVVERWTGNDGEADSGAVPEAGAVPALRRAGAAGAGAAAGVVAVVRLCGGVAGAPGAAGAGESPDGVFPPGFGGIGAGAAGGESVPPDG